MKKTNNSERETERRRKVAEEKIWGAIIENIERMRKQPMAHSIISRLFFLYKSIDQFQSVVKEMGITSPYGHMTPAPSFTVEQTNFLIRTYNDVIEDIHSHLKKKDSYVDKFSTFEELDEPTINDVAKTFL